MFDIAAVLITLDRTPRRNYLGETLDNLERGQFFASKRLHSFRIVDSGSSATYIAEQLRGRALPVITSEVRRNARQNVSQALLFAGQAGAKWVLFMEDDIDVCDNFLNSVGKWLDDHEREDRRIYAFGAAYAQIAQARTDGMTAWNYPIEAFYGTQCIALRTHDALGLSQHLHATPFVRGVDAPQAYDIAMSDWMREKYPSIRHFLASAPCFVQHLGEQSALGSKFFTFQAFAGRNWSYSEPGVTVL